MKAYCVHRSTTCRAYSSWRKRGLSGKKRVGENKAFTSIRALGRLSLPRYCPHVPRALARARPNPNLIPLSRCDIPFPALEGCVVQWFEVKVGLSRAKPLAELRPWTVRASWPVAAGRDSE